MTEAGWLTATEPYEALDWLQDKTVDRKARLYMVACCRNIEGFLWIDDHCIRSVTVAERFADGLCKRAALDEANSVMSWEVAGGPFYRHPVREACFYCTHHTAPAAQCAHYAALSTILTRNWRDPDDRAGHNGRCLASASLAHVRLMHCIFGNPFRVPAFARQWCTDTALALARQMYESRDFGAMPILADALQDAGCDNDDILTHCRGPGPHYRGCWVVDLVLGKA